MLIRKFPDKERFIELARDHNVVPVCVELLADMETPVSLLTKFYRDQGPIFLLESVEGGEKWGRYSIIGLPCHTMLKVYGHRAEVWEHILHTARLLRGRRELRGGRLGRRCQA